jgi:hypothetical protein
MRITRKIPRIFVGLGDTAPTVLVLDMILAC